MVKWTVRKRGALAWLIMALSLYALNPYWYGDAVWYATDLRASELIRQPDPGHLAWRGLGWLVWNLLSRIYPDVDALQAFQILSALGGALAALVTYHLALRFSLSKDQACASALLLFSSHFMLAYGGSGSAYPAAVALALASFLPILQQDGEWRIRHGVLSIILFLGGWGCWGISILLFPALLVCAFVSACGSAGVRLMRSSLLGSALLALIGGVLLVTYLTGVERDLSFSAWLSSGAHGIAPNLSLIGVARALLGSIIAFLFLGDMGITVKALLLGGAAEANISSSIPALTFLICFVALVILSLRRVAQCIGTNPQVFFLVIVAASAFLPVLLFAVLWQGSDVERFCLALPLISILLGIMPQSGNSSTAGWRKRAALYALPVFLLITNLLSNNIPALADRGGIVTSLGERALTQLKPGDLLVLHGQDLGPRVWAPTIYFSDLKVHSVLYDFQTNGLAGWEARLTEAIDLQLCHGRNVAVLGDLLGQPTPGGIGLIQSENPRPSLEEIEQLLGQWNKGSSWSVEQYTFVALLLPPETLRCRQG